MEYISRIFSLPRFPSGQSALKPLQGDVDGDGDGDVDGDGDGEEAKMVKMV